MKKYRTVWRALLLLLVMSLGGLVLVQVYRRAWVSEDAFITLRYVSNALGGHGVVFNPGERVQGYSHPLWLLMLLVGCATGVDHIYVVVVSGMGLTLLLIFVLFAHGVRLSPNPWRGILAGLGVLAVWACSESWLSFQTGGLENPLAHLLIAMFTISVLTKGYSRPFFISFLSALIALTRPDLALLTAPVCLAVVCRFRQWRQMMSFTAGLLPLITWVILAWLYYGTPVPNPAYAKLGIYPTAKAAVGQGLRYVDDWFRYDPGGGWGFALFLLVALFEEGRSRVIPPVIGIGLYLLWVICIGGDFMRGRLFTPILTMTGVLAANRLAVRGRGLRGLLAGSR
ncbi:MAG: hypothetical protein N3G20_06495, partial [Verrucomicrobiae bacterium]|nr:hypothetical protein [Verrucomicrobiae bacterium]